MLCFQVVESDNAIQIYCDDKGVTALIAALEKVRKLCISAFPST